MQTRIVYVSLALAMACAAVGGLSGCAMGNTTIAKESADTLGSKLVPGKTTKEDVQKEFGEPMTKSFAGGRETWAYQMYDSSVRTFIPFAGLITGVEGQEMTDLSIDFDKRGRVVRHVFAKTKN